MYGGNFSTYLLIKENYYWNQDGVLYYNRRSTHQSVNCPFEVDRAEEIHHELACYNLRQLTYAPILRMLPDLRQLMVTKFNEHSFQGHSLFSDHDPNTL